LLSRRTGCAVLQRPHPPYGRTVPSHGLAQAGRPAVSPVTFMIFGWTFHAVRGCARSSRPSPPSA
jgi:hypothetical protein